MSNDNEPEDVRGCSCGMADWGAPGHDGHPQTYCKYVFDGTDTDGTPWYQCTVHDELAPSNDAPCDGYHAPPYVDPLATPEPSVTEALADPQDAMHQFFTLMGIDPNWVAQQVTEHPTQDIADVDWTQGRKDTP